MQRNTDYWEVFGVNFFVFISFCIVATLIQLPDIMGNSDAFFLAASVKAWMMNPHIAFHNQAAILSGLFNQNYYIMFDLNIGYVLAKILGIKEAVPFAIIIYGAEIFFCLYAVSWVLGLSASVRTGAAWIGGLVFLHLTPLKAINDAFPLTNTVVHNAELVFWQGFLYFIVAIDRFKKGILLKAFLHVLFVLIVFLNFSSNPTVWLLFMCFPICYAVFLWLARFRPSHVLLFPLYAVVVFVVNEKYILGTIKYTAYSTFQKTFTSGLWDFPTWHTLFFSLHAPLLLQIFGWAGILGAIISIFQKRSQEISLFYLLAVFFLQLVNVVCGLFTIRLPFSLSYVEVGLASLGSIFCAVACVEIGRMLLLKLTSKKVINTRYSVAVCCLLVIGFAYFFSSQSPSLKLLYPPSPTVGTVYLKSAVGVEENKVFRGVTASFITGHDLVRRKNLFADLLYQDYYAAKYIGNDSRMGGLMLHDIPILDIYNPLMSPTYFLFISKLLEQADESPHKSSVSPSVVNERVLAMLGVAYFQDDASEERGRAPILTQWIGNQHRRLFSVAKPNLGNYSPALARFVPSSEATLQAIAHPDFSPEKEVLLTSEAVTELSFVEANEKRMYIENEGFRIKAESSGRSLLLLPIQFSHCLKLESSAASNAFFTRANFLLTGLIFENLIDASIRYKHSPIENAQCKWKDYMDMLEMNVTGSYGLETMTGHLPVGEDKVFSQ